MGNKPEDHSSGQASLTAFFSSSSDSLSRPWLSNVMDTAFFGTA